MLDDPWWAAFVGRMWHREIVFVPTCDWFNVVSVVCDDAIDYSCTIECRCPTPPSSPPSSQERWFHFCRWVDGCNEGCHDRRAEARHELTTPLSNCPNITNCRTKGVAKENAYELWQVQDGLRRGTPSFQARFAASKDVDSDGMSWAAASRSVEQLIADCSVHVRNLQAHAALIQEPAKLALASKEALVEAAGE